MNEPAARSWRDLLNAFRRPDREKRYRRFRSAVLLMLIVAAAVMIFGVESSNGHYGWWSVAPPLIAIVLAFWTREVVSSLFAGVLLGGLIAGEINLVQAYMIPSIGSESFALILLVYLWALGGLIGIWTRTGGAETFARWAGERFVKGPRSAKLFTWVMGLVFHQGGTISTILTGATVRPVADKHRVSHEELSYVVDSTASPAATLIPFNVWPFYVGGLVAGTIPLFETQMDGVTFFFASIGYNFYAVFAILLTLLFSIEKLPFIPGKKMRLAISRARTEGSLDRKGAIPMASEELSRQRIPEGYRSGLIDFLGPIGTLLAVAILPYLYTYYVLGNTDSPTLLVAEAFVLAVLAGIGIAVSKGMSLRDAMDGFIDGCKGVTIGAVILALAVTLKEVTDTLGTATFVVEQLGSILRPVFLPGILMGLCMLIAFSTGTSWGTFAVVFPVAMPLAWAIQPDPLFISLCFSAVVGGAVFGDQCSPISDTTILSSLATGSDLMDHVTSQFPLALTAGALSVFAYALMVILFI